VARHIAQGSSTREALAALRERVGVDTVVLMTVALRVADEQGGRLGLVLDRIAHTADELNRIHRKRDADTASGRLMVTLMAVFPAAFLGLVYALDPAMVATAFGTLVGQLVLATAAAIVYASVRWASRILHSVR
jgi:tight adherence protein B